MGQCPFCGSSVVFISNAMVPNFEYTCQRCKRPFTSEGREGSHAVEEDELPPLPPFLDERQRREYEKQYWKDLGVAMRGIKPSPEAIELLRRHEQAVRAERYRWLRELVVEVTRLVRREPRVHTGPYEGQRGPHHGSEPLSANVPQTPMIALAAVASVVVAVGLLRMPFGYYMLLRIVLCLGSVAGIVAARRRGDSPWVWTYAVLAIVYNPVLSLKLGSKGLWIGLNVIAIACLWVGALRFRGVRPPDRSQ